jgi:hypothetical protein
MYMAEVGNLVAKLGYIMMLLLHAKAKVCSFIENIINPKWLTDSSELSIRSVYFL